MGTCTQCGGVVVRPKLVDRCRWCGQRVCAACWQRCRHCRLPAHRTEGARSIWHENIFFSGETDG